MFWLMFTCCAKKYKHKTYAETEWQLYVDTVDEYIQGKRDPDPLMDLVRVATRHNWKAAP